MSASICCRTQAGGVAHLAHPDALVTDCGRRIGTIARNAEVRDDGELRLCEHCEDRAFDRWRMGGGKIVRMSAVLDAVRREVDRHPLVSSDGFDQAERYRVARRVADEQGAPITIVLPVVHGYADQWQALPPAHRDNGAYLRGYIAPCPGVLPNTGR